MSRNSFAHSGGALQLATSYPAIVGAVLLNLREGQGVKQADFAAQMGVAPSTWSRIENGGQAMSIDQLAQVAQALSIRPGEIIRRADAAQDAAHERKVRVEPARISHDDALGLGLAMIGAAALGAFIGGVAAQEGRSRNRYR
jgi:transcriptional regulator with XRE-family HTH domain